MSEPIRIKKEVKHHLPHPGQVTAGAAGYDLVTSQQLRIHPGEQVMVPTGYAWEIPEDYCGRISSRSGLARRYRLTVNAGLIDSDYRGEVCVLLENRGNKTFHAEAGERIAQMTIHSICTRPVKLVNSLNTTERNNQGFGHTGT